VIGRSEAVLAVVLAVVYSVLAAALPLLDDEVYYWCWAQTPQLSYYDHAPLSAYMIWLSTKLLGDSSFAIRLPAVLSSIIVVLTILRLMQPTTLWPWVVMTPLYTFGAVLITPDTPFLLFWTLYLAWLITIHESLGAEGISPWRWVLGGIFLGLGALGKYTMALAVPCTLVSFLVAHPRLWKTWLPGYIGHGVVSFLVFLPVVIFNFQRDFVSIRFQWEHAMNSDDPGGVKTFGEFFIVQIVLFGLMPAVVWVWSLWDCRRLNTDSRLRVAAIFFMLPWAFFLWKSWRGPLEGNWALASYVGCWPLAAHWHGNICPARWRVPVRVVTFGVPFVVVMGLLIHLVTPIAAFPIRQDRISRQAPRIEAVRAGVAAAKADGRPIPIFTPTYQMTALLRYAGGAGEQMAEISRPSHFTMIPKYFEDCEECYVWNETALPIALCAGFAEPRLVGSFPVMVRGEAITGYHLLHYRKLQPGEASPQEMPSDHRLKQGADWFLKPR
jgi:Dolichyl-phosphate-mannose-protein mannosyltransferase